MILLKPDCFERKIVAPVIQALHDRGHYIIDAQVRILNKYEVEALYAHHRTAIFWPRIYDFMTSGPSMVLKVTGDSADIRESALAIRQAFYVDSGNSAANVIHASGVKDVIYEDDLFNLRDRRCTR